MHAHTHELIHAYSQVLKRQEQQRQQRTNWAIFVAWINCMNQQKMEANGIVLVLLRVRALLTAAAFSSWRVTCAGLLIFEYESMKLEMDVCQLKYAENDE